MNPAPDAPRVAGYTVLERIGSGGFGSVWRARRDDGTEVALKVVEPRRALDSAVADRLFRREALASLNLDHPGLVRALDAGRAEDGRPWIAFEFIEGPTLGRTMREKGPLTEPGTLALARTLASALDHAHRRGVVHGDVSPGNVLLSSSGARLLDLGLARPLAEAAGGPVFATPGYSAPETLAGGAPTAASDLFALGMTAGAALLGRPLVESATTGEYARALEAREPTIPEDACGPGLRAVLGRCVRREPAARYRSAAELLLDLDALRAGESPLGAALASTGVRLGARRRRAAMAALAGVAVAAFAGAILLRSGSGGSGRERDPAPAPVPSVSPDPVLVKIETLRVLLTREPPDFDAMEALSREIAAAAPSGAAAAGFENARRELDRRKAEAAVGIEAAHRERERVAEAARESVAATDRRIAMYEANLGAVSLESPDAHERLSTTDDSLRRLLEDPALSAAQRDRVGELRTRVGSAVKTAAAADRERNAEERWRVAVERLARDGDGRYFRYALAAIVASFEGDPPGRIGALLVDCDARVRRADAAVARALESTKGRAWARRRGERFAVEHWPEPPAAADSLGPWWQNFPELPGERQSLSILLEADLVGITGDREDAYCWALAQGFLWMARHGPEKGTARTLASPRAQGPAESTHAPWFSRELFQGLRPTAARQVVHPGNAVTDAWDNFLRVRNGETPWKPLPVRPRANPVKDAGLNAFLADDLPGAWTLLEEAAEADPLDAEVAVLRAQLLRAAAKPLPTLPVQLYALCEARRAWDLDPGLPAAAALTAEIALEILERDGKPVRLTARVEEGRDPEHVTKLLRCVATMACEEAMRMGRETPPMLLHLGRARWDAGRRDEGRALLRRARDLLGDALPAWAAEILR